MGEGVQDVQPLERRIRRRICDQLGFPLSAIRDKLVDQVPKVEDRYKTL